MADLAGKRVVILGGGGMGIGGAVTRLAATHGASILVVDKDPEQAGRAAESGRDIFPLAADITDPDEIDRVFGQAQQLLGGVDVLLTVVGGHHRVASWSPVAETTALSWDRVFDINLRYVFLAVKRVLPIFISQGTGGSIVSIGSIAALNGMPMAAPYGASKAGLISLAKTVAVEYGRHDIRMNVVSCGAIQTQVSAEGAPSDIARPIPLGRSGRPDEIAEAVVFLASARASYISGQALAVDGAVMARFPLPILNADTTMSG